MIINEIRDTLLQYDAVLELLRVRWVGGDDMTHYRANTERIIQTCHRLGVRSCLVEMDSLPNISVYDQLWLGTHLLPSALKLPLTQVVFCISASQVHNQLAIDALIALARPLMRFDIHFFAQASSGMRWLVNDTRRLAALEAEWEAAGTPPVADVAEPLALYK